MPGNIVGSSKLLWVFLVNQYALYYIHFADFLDNAVVAGFETLSKQDRSALATELARTGVAFQSYRRSPVSGGPAFLAYHAIASRRALH